MTGPAQECPTSRVGPAGGPARPDAGKAVRATASAVAMTVAMCETRNGFSGASSPHHGCVASALRREGLGADGWLETLHRDQDKLVQHERVFRNHGVELGAVAA